MNNYIQIYKNAIDDEYCDELINKFEIESNKETYDQGPMSFTQFNLNQNKCQGDIERLTSVFSNSLKQYVDYFLYYVYLVRHMQTQRVYPDILGNYNKCRFGVDH